MISSGDRTEALKRLSALLQGDPDSAHLWYLVSRATTDPEKRQKALRKALSLDPEHAEALQSLHPSRPTSQASTAQVTPRRMVSAGSIALTAITYAALTWLVVGIYEVTRALAALADASRQPATSGLADALGDIVLNANLSYAMSVWLLPGVIGVIVSAPLLYWSLNRRRRADRRSVVTLAALLGIGLVLAILVVGSTLIRTRELERETVATSAAVRTSTSSAFATLFATMTTPRASSP